MNIEYDVSEQDYINFNLFHIKTSKKMRKSIWAADLTIAAILILASVFLFFVFKDRVVIPIYILVSLALIIFWVLFFPKWYELLLKRTIKKMIKRNESSFTPHQTLTLKEDFIISKNSANKSNVEYDTIQRLESANNCIYIYINEIKAYIVPFSAFSGLNEKSKFEQILEEKTGLKIAAH